MECILRLNAKVFPIITVIAFIMQIIDSSRVWVTLLIGTGGTWLFCFWWMRGFARSLGFKCEMRYCWAQVGDRLEERFTLTNQFILPVTWVAVHDQSTLPDHRTSVATGVDGNSKSQWKVLHQCIGVFWSIQARLYHARNRRSIRNLHTYVRGSDIHHARRHAAGRSIAAQAFIHCFDLCISKITNMIEYKPD